MSDIRLNRSRRCNVCKREKFRVLVPSPKEGDPDYTVALCPACDMTAGKEDRRANR